MRSTVRRVIFGFRGYIAGRPRLDAFVRQSLARVPPLDKGLRAIVRRERLIPNRTAEVLSRREEGSVADLSPRDRRVYLDSVQRIITVRSPERTDPLSLRVLFCLPDETPFGRSENALYIDQAAITAQLIKGSDRVGAIPSSAMVRVAVKLARLLADRFALLYAQEIGLDRRLISNALYFNIWTEICALVPLRHLARRLLSEAKDKTIYIELVSLDMAYLGLWAFNELEPIFLYTEIVRRGGLAVLVHRAAQADGSPADTI